MTSKCNQCGNRFDILDTYRCNYDVCNQILCRSCSKDHKHLPDVKISQVQEECVDPECGGCYTCFPAKYKCDCRQYKNLNWCEHVAAITGNGW